MSSNSLILIHVVARHGNRTADTMAAYPKDPHRNNDFYPYGIGMLTNEGKNACYALGKAYRERYDEFLGELYLPEYLESWSTEMIRCRVSAEIFLAGLFPPNDILKWNDELNWQPIHINYRPYVQDELLGGPVKLKAFMDAYYKIYDTEYGKNIMGKYQDIIPYVNEHTGLKIHSVRQLALLSDNFRTYSEIGLELPPWSKSIYPERLREAAYDELRIHSTILKKYVCGKFLKKVLDDTKNKINKKSLCKMHLYMCHDYNVSAMLGVLGSIFNHYPTYCASVSLEVHQINGKHGIKMFYKETYDSDFALTPFGNGETILWIEELEELVNDILSDDLEA